MRSRLSITVLCLSFSLIAIGLSLSTYGQADDASSPDADEQAVRAQEQEAPEKRTDVWLAALLEPDGVGSSDRDPDQGLVNANFQYVTDSQGFRWDVQASYGGINDGTNDAFDGGLYLFVNNAQFSASSQFMIADGQEYVFTNTMNALQVTRRVYINRELGAVRYLEIFQNRTDQLQKVAVEVRTDLGSTPQGIVANDGKPLAGALAKEQVGIYAVSHGGSRPSVAFLLADARDKKYRPNIRTSSDDVFVTWQLEVPPKDTVVILHAVAQRNGNNPVPAFEALYDRGFVHAQVPKDLRKKIVNFKVSPQLSGTPLLDSVSLLAEDFDLERGDDDLLWIDEETVIAGRVNADELIVTSRFGKTAVPWEDVAAIIGGADVDARMTLLLRNGEVLHGVISAKQMTLSSPDGIDVDINLSKLGFLLARTSPKDNAVPAAAQLMLATASGQRLLITNSKDSILRAATPWGELNVPIDQVAYLAPDEETGFSQRVLLRDGTRLTLVPQPSLLEVNTLRFAAVSLPAAQVQRICRLIRMKEDADASGQEQVPLAPETPTAPFVTLAGENMLPGKLAFDSLTLHHDKGQELIKAVDIKEIRLVSTEGIQPIFEVKRRAGETLEGRLGVTHFRLLGELRDWDIPATHLQAYDAGDLLPKIKPEPEANLDPKPAVADDRGTLQAAEASYQRVPDFVVDEKPLLPSPIEGRGRGF